MMAAAPRKRRRWPWVLAVLLVIGGIVVWRVALDRARMTAFLIDHARTDLGLEISLGAPARFDFWPRLAVQAENVRAAAVGATLPLVEARRLIVSVPWSALWAGEVRIEGIRIENPTVHTAQLDQWWASRARADDGPPLPLRWPTINSLVTLRNLRWIEADGVGTQGPLSLTFARLAVDEAFEPTLRWRRDGVTYRLQWKATPRNTDGGIALADLSARWNVDSVADDPQPTASATPRPKLTTEQLAMPIDLSGRLAFDSAAAWSAELKLVAATWPAWLPTLPETGAPDTRSDLALRLVRGGAAAFALVADGTLGGVPIRASLVGANLPDFSKPVPELLDEISTQWRGRTEIPLLRIQGTRIEGLRVEAGENATSPQ